MSRRRIPMHPMPPAHRRLPRFALATAGLLLALAAPNEAYAQTTCNVSDATTQATGAFNWHRISTNSGANLPAATVFYRTLITLGVSPLPAWTGSNISGNAPTTTITAAEARTFQAGSTWSGWNPILDALDCLEAQVVTPGPDPDPVPDPDFGPDPVPDPTLPVGPTHMPRIVLNRDEFVVEEPQADNCSDDKVGDETTWIPVDANKRPITDGSAPAFWKVERNYGPVLTAVGYKVALDRSPGAGKFVSVEIWDPTDLDRTDIWDGSSGAPGRKGRFEENARIHGTGWQLGRQGRITVANSELPGNPSAPVPYEAQPLTNTYLTFTDEDWDEPRKVQVNVHCAHHDVTNPLPVWHFAFRHDVPRPVNPGSAYPNGGAEELPLGYETNRKGDNSPNNTSLKIAQVRVVDSTAPAAITSDIAGGIELDPTRSLDVIKRSNGDGLVRRIGLEFTWNNPDTSHTNDYQHARENFTGFRVTLRSLEDGTVQERFVPTSGSTSIDDFQVPFYANFEAESIGVTVDAHGFAQPTDTNDEKFEWSVVPVNWRWDDVGAERVTRCVLLTYRKPNGTIPYIDTDATPTCPAAQQGESEGASTPAVSVPDTAVANVRATAVDDTSASVSWDAVEHATAYEVSWDGSGSGTAVTGILPGVTGTTTTIQHNAQEAMTLTVTVTPEYVDGNGQLVQLSSLAGTATLDVGPSGGSDDGGGTDGGDGGDAIGAGTDAVDLPAAVAHWRFDGDADDAAGSSDGAAMNGASFTADARSGSHALVLDGVDDHVDLASHVSNFPLGDAARSVTGWFKAEAGNQRQTFFTYGPNVAGQRFSIAADRTQALVAVSGHARGVNGLSLDDGWHHVAVTHAGGNSDGISIYLDGTLQPASTLVGAPQALDTRAGPAAIGRNAGGTEHYAGSIDDVRIYDVALGAEQVLALFNERPQTPAPVTTAVTASASPALAEGNLDGADVELTLDAGAYAATLATSDITASGVSGVGVSSVTRDGDTQATATLAFDGTDFDADATLMLTVSAGALAHSDAALSATLPVTAVDEPPPAVSIPTPVAHWRFDGDADDSAGSSNGSARNGASFTSAASVGSHALSLDGVDDHVDLGSHASSFPLGNAARSVTGWFRADAGNQRQTFLTYGPNVEGKRLSIAADRTQAVVAVSGHAWGVNNLSLADGWHHVAVTFAGGRSDEFSIYLDGALQSAATLGGVRRQVDTRTGTAAIGRNVGGTAHYDGDIDDVRLYNHALSAAQVRAIAGQRETAGAGDGARATAALPGGPLPAPLARPRASGGADGTGADGADDFGADGFGPGGAGPATASSTRTHAPLLPSSSNPLREGLVRIVNSSAQAGEVRIVAIDDAGWRGAPVTLAIGAGETAQFTARDLEWGNVAIGLSGSTGSGTGDWRLEVSSRLDIEVLPHARAADGTLSAMGDIVAAEDNVHRVALFHPADGPDAASRLRLTNRGAQALRADITGIDDAGASPGGMVSVEIEAHASVWLAAAELEAGGSHLLGALGDGEGQWRLAVASDGDLAVMNLVETSDGRLANLSNAAATTVPARAAHVVDRFPSSSDMANEQGVVRVVNNTGSPASIRIEPHDGTGWRHAPLTLTLGANAAANLGTWDLELGNAAKGLAGNTGPATGGPWRLTISSNADIEVLAYVRAPNGLLKVPPGDTETKDKAR